MWPAEAYIETSLTKFDEPPRKVNKSTLSAVGPLASHMEAVNQWLTQRRTTATSECRHGRRAHAGPYHYHHQRTGGNVFGDPK